MFFFAWLTRATGWKSAALTGFAFGFGNFVTGVWWLYVSMHYYGGMAAPLAGAAVVLFSLYLALYPALAAGVWSFWRSARNGAATTTTVLADLARRAGVCERVGDRRMAARHRVHRLSVARERLCAGRRPVRGIRAGGRCVWRRLGAGAGRGVDRASAVACACAPSRAAAARRSQARMQRQQRGKSALHRAHRRAGGARVALIAAGLLLPLVQWTVPANAPLTVRLLQGNVKQDMKFEEAGMRAAIDQYQQMITSKPADLIVTPETAIPVLAQQLPRVRGGGPRVLRFDRHSILFGAIGGTITPEGQVVDYTNSLFGVTPGSRDVYRYDKHHLVPFGEFVPWGFRWFVNLMSIPLGDFARGAPVQKPFMVHNQPVSRRHLLRGYFRRRDRADHPRERDAAGVLVNSTNLAWFGDTIALDQHLQIARMRSLETGRPMLRATNTGMTAAIDAQRQGDRTPDAVHDWLARLTVQGTSGNTPYVTSGNNTVLAVSLLLLAFGLRSGRGSRGAQRQANGKK